MAALNAGDEPALLATLHFPHYRRAGGRMQVWDQPGADLATFSPVPARTGTTANGIFARLSPPDRPRCIWTYNSPVIASTIRSLARSAHCGSSPSATDAGPWRRGRASRIDLQVKTGDRIYLDAQAKA